MPVVLGLADNHDNTDIISCIWNNKVFSKVQIPPTYRQNLGGLKTCDIHFISYCIFLTATLVNIDPQNFTMAKSSPASNQASG